MSYKKELELQQREKDLQSHEYGLKSHLLGNIEQAIDLLEKAKGAGIDKAARDELKEYIAEQISNLNF